ncbi:MAG: hypothetical protein H9532_01850 [Vulcanococcus sp. Clear-D1]|nr:hypothetical protein [Vulcanococcus sp. Clear-D1]
MRIMRRTTDLLSQAPYYEAIVSACGIVLVSPSRRATTSRSVKLTRS